MIEDYLSNTINIILDSKLPKERKDKLLRNLKIMFKSYLKRGIRLCIDEKGFEYFKQKIKDEE